MNWNCNHQLKLFLHWICPDNIDLHFNEQKGSLCATLILISRSYFNSSSLINQLDLDLYRVLIVTETLWRDFRWTTENECNSIHVYPSMLLKRQPFIKTDNYIDVDTTVFYFYFYNLILCSSFYYTLVSFSRRSIKETQNHFLIAKMISEYFVNLSNNKNYYIFNNSNANVRKSNENILNVVKKIM